MLENAAAAIYQQQSSGRASYGCIAEWIKTLQDNGIDMETDKLRNTFTNKCRKLKTKDEAKENGTTVPGITPLRCKTVIREVLNALDDSNNCSGLSIESRPVANQTRFEHENLLMVAHNKVAIAYKEIVEACKRNNQRVPYGSIDTVISEIKMQLGLPENAMVNKATVRNRLRRTAKSLTPAHRGKASPLAAIEPRVVAKVMEMAKVNQPMDKGEVLAYINSLIEGTEHQARLVTFKTQCKFSQKDENLHKVGPGYYQGFLKRYSHLFQRKNGRLLCPSTVQASDTASVP